jgi:hypothetical protein
MTAINFPYKRHLTSSADLQTSYPAYRAGFISLALERNRRATPFVDEARKLRSVANTANSPTDLLKMKDIRGALLTAAGISDKASGYLEEEDKTEAIAGLISTFLDPAGTDFVEELVYRFLLTRGDTLGGSMRNVGGALAQRKLTRSLISCLNLAGTKYWWTDKRKKTWNQSQSSVDDADIEIGLVGLAWENSNGRRMLIYNLNVPIVKNNIDICLFNADYSVYGADTVSKPALYLALGELKGGIDPAGADEHWKTARTALDRIHRSFQDLTPATFFISAAIEKKMASEIWELLENTIITNAANLTNEDHVSAISRWLCEL